MVQKWANWVIILGLILTIFFWWPWAPVPFEVPKATFFGYFVKLLALFFAYDFFTKKPEWKIDSKIFYLIAGLTIWSLITAILGTNIGKSFVGNYYRNDGLLTLFDLVGFALLISYFWKDDFKKKISYTYYISALILSVMTFFEIMSGRFGLGSATTFGNPNFLAGFLAVSLPFVFYLYKTEKQKFYLIGVFVIAAAVILIGAVSPIITLILYLILFVIFYFRNKYKYLIIGAMIMCATCIAYFWIRDYSLANSQSFIAEGRMRIYRNIFTGALKRPLFGYGWANVDSAFESSVWPLKFNNDVYVDKAHSEFLEIFATTGIPGLIIYLILIGSVLIKLWKSHKTSTDKDWEITLISILILYLFHSQTNVISITEQIIFWIIIGVTLVYLGP